MQRSPSLLGGVARERRIDSLQQERSWRSGATVNIGSCVGGELERRQCWGREAHGVVGHDSVVIQVVSRQHSGRPEMCASWECGWDS
jgi:hypothetical protein